MDRKRYDFWTTVFLIIAVASAFVFDSGYIPKWAAGSIGIMAATMSIYTYFRYGGGKPNG